MNRAAIANDSAAVEKCKAIGLWPYMLANSEKGQGGDGARDLFLVNCWFLGKSESSEMWQTFGDGGKRVAIRSTVNRLASSFFIPGDFRLISSVGRVNYVDFKSHKCCDGNDTAEVSLLKDKTFESENEVRVLVWNNCLPCYLKSDGSPASRPGKSFFMPRVKGFYIPCDLGHLVQSIIAGPNMPPFYRDLMKRIVGQDGKPVNVECSNLASWT